MKWRLGLDIGTNSIGWAAFEIDGTPLTPHKLLGTGVRIFSDGRDEQTKQSLAATRRAARSARRRRDRFIQRRSRFMQLLIDRGLMPSDETERQAFVRFERGDEAGNQRKDPWNLRVKGLDEPLTRYELGRALFHLNQRRGFQSNRKIDKADDDGTKISVAAQNTQEAMRDAGVRTFGEWLAKPRLEDPEHAHQRTVRARLHGQGASAYYDFYPTRNLIAAEFDALWTAQKGFHGTDLSDEARDELRHLLVWQRPLKAQPVGKCSLDPKEERAPNALPSSQRRRIYQDVNHLEIRQPGHAGRKLTLEERDQLIELLLNRPKLSFDQIRRQLRLGDAARFNYENDMRRKHLDGDQTAAILAFEGSGKRPARWGKSWRELSLEVQDALVEILLGQERSRGKDRTNPSFPIVARSISETLNLPLPQAEGLLESTDEELIVNWLTETFALPEEQTRAVATALLPDGYDRLGRTATRRVVEALNTGRQDYVNVETGEIVARPLTYKEAVLAAGYESHEKVDREGNLPYYGAVLERQVAFGTGEPLKEEDANNTAKIEKSLGKVANPTVHVALNQLRRVVNALIDRWGAPTQISVELARDLPLSARGKSELEREQTANQEANDRRRQELAALDPPQRDTYENRLRLRLYEELGALNKCCPYSGKQIGIRMLFSDEVEIDHILPFSKTLDDGIANKTLCTREANRRKNNRSPFDAFEHGEGDYAWDQIAARAANFPPNKAWRFAPDAMDRFENEERNFLDRQLNETRYISRLARGYLKATGADVWVTPGRLTSDLRHQWGLNSVLHGHNREEAVDPQKNRNDHRHHAIDAVVVAMTDRSLLQKVATTAGRAETQHQNALNLVEGLDDPWPSFRDDVRDSVQSMVVSHRLDHGLGGRLHEDTAYGTIQDPKTGAPRLARRKPITSLTPGEIQRIGDLKIREDLVARTKGLSGKGLESELNAYSSETGVKRVRVHSVEADYELIEHGKGYYKAVIPGENFCIDVVETPDGTWRCVGVTRFEAARESRLGTTDPKWKTDYPTARHIMRLHKGDMLRLEYNGRETEMRVVQLNPSSNRIRLVEHFEAGEYEKRHKIDQDDDPFRWDLATVSKLKSRMARLLHIDPAGAVRDPGPPQ